MTRQLRIWSALSLALATALAGAGLALRSAGDLPFYRQPVIDIVLAVAVGLAIVAVAVLLATFRWSFPAEDAAPEPRHRRRPYRTLFIVSFVALFVELMLIRYCGSQIRIFSFYKNIPLIAAFLGLGLGCTLGRGGSRQAFQFLLWLTPLSAFLSAGSLTISQWLGKHAAIASSEQILGDFVPTAADRAGRTLSLLLVTLFCVATFVAITLLFAFLGRMMGDAFNRVERLPGYTVNIAGSLAGIVAFIALSYVQTPPWVWFLVGLLPLLWWSPRGSGGKLALAGLVLINALAVWPSYGHTVWSPYQKLVGHAVASSPGQAADAYLLEISDVFYQAAVDRRPERLQRDGFDPAPHYDAFYRYLPRPTRVLVVGAGMGNDVASALRAGAKRVDAVDIDPAIVATGRAHHPERPYEDRRVRVIVDDARQFMRRHEPSYYDVVVFGLLDSHTQLGMSSVRLDNYVFTLESFSDAARLVRPGGHVVVSAATFDDWFRDRLRAMLGRAVGSDVAVLDHGVWKSYVGEVGATPADAGRALDAGIAAVSVPTDDWPFLYLPRRGVPPAYLWVLGCLVVASIAVLRLGGLPLGSLDATHGHLFFLGAAFLLMEVHAINRLALLFGTVWLVSGVTIAVVLLLIVAANFTVMRFPRMPYGLAYAGLAVSLGVSFWIEPTLVVGLGAVAELAFSFVLLSPVFFAGLVFARSFGAAPLAAPAMGANILGSVLGGWVEYGTMLTGVRGLVLVAAGFYTVSLLLLILSRRNGQRS